MQSTILSIASDSHPSVQLSPPTVSTSFTLSCSTCSPYKPHTLSSRNGRILVLTDDHVQVFAAMNADEGTRVNWTQSLTLDAECTPLYIQALSTGPDSFIVVCTTPTSLGYQVISSSSGVFQLQSLLTPDSDVSDLIFGSYKPLHSPESDAFVYVRNGELTFGTLFDGQASVPVFLDDTSCGLNSVATIYPLLKQVQDKFRFLLDCSHQETNAVLRYIVTLFLGDPLFPESVHLLPASLATGTPISSPDSDYFVIVQNSSIAVVKTEDPELYKVHSFPYALHEVSFTESVVPTLSVVSPGHNHVLIHVDSFINDSNTSVIELADSPAFCPNQSVCLPHNMATPTVFFTFTKSLTEEKESTLNFSLVIYDIGMPSIPLLRIDNLAVQPKMAFPRDVSLLFPVISTTEMYYRSTTPVPSPTYSPSVLISTNFQIDSIPASPLPTSVISSSNFVVDSSSTTSTIIVDRSSSTAMQQTPTLNNSNRDKKFSLSSTITVILVVIFCVLTVVLLLVVVISFIFFTAQKQAQKSTVANRTRDEEKFIEAVSLSLTPYSISAVNPTTTAYDDSGTVSVNTVGVPETSHTPVSRSSSDQVLHVPPLTLDLKSSAHTPASGDDANSSGISSVADTPSTNYSGELATNKQ